VSAGKTCQANPRCYCSFAAIVVADAVATTVALAALFLYSKDAFHSFGQKGKARAMLQNSILSDVIQAEFFNVQLLLVNCKENQRGHKWLKDYHEYK
jgi:hypothetical protein